MNIKIKSLSKNEDFKKILSGRKISNSYLTIFFKKIPNKGNACLNISFVAKKKMGKAVDRNKIKRRLKNMTYTITKIAKLNLSLFSRSNRKADLPIDPVDPNNIISFLLFINILKSD